MAEREGSSRGIAADESARSIAARLGRAPSTVSREIKRHRGRSSYRATDADTVAWESGLRPQLCAFALNATLRNIVASKLGLDWSPEQVATWLELQYPHESACECAHETIYRSLFIQARGALKKELIAHLRTRRTMRRSRRAGATNELRGQIPDAVSIRDRPAEIEDRAVPGHWEGDLISGSKNSHIATLVERHSRYTALVKAKNKETATVIAALARQVRKLPASLRRSLT